MISEDISQVCSDGQFLQSQQEFFTFKSPNQRTWPQDPPSALKAEWDKQFEFEFEVDQILMEFTEVFGELSPTLNGRQETNPRFPCISLLFANHRETKSLFIISPLSAIRGNQTALFGARAQLSVNLHAFHKVPLLSN